MAEHEKSLLVAQVWFLLFHYVHKLSFCIESLNKVLENMQLYLIVP